MSVRLSRWWLSIGMAFLLCGLLAVVVQAQCQIKLCKMVDCIMLTAPDDCLGFFDVARPTEPQSDGRKVFVAVGGGGRHVASGGQILVKTCACTTPECNPAQYPGRTVLPTPATKAGCGETGNTMPAYRCTGS